MVRILDPSQSEDEFLHAENANLVPAETNIGATCGFQGLPGVGMYTSNDKKGVLKMGTPN